MYRYEYNSSGSYLTESGVFDPSKRTYLGSGWYYAWNTFTTQPTCSNMTCYAFSYNYSSFNDKYSYAKVAILEGDLSGLHPRYWPDLNSSISNTQALKDLTGLNTITANSLTYNGNNTFSFNGSSNYMDCGNHSSIASISGSTSVTVEAWVNLSGYGSTNGYGVITHKGYPWAWLMENPSNTMRIRFYLSSSGDVSCSDSLTHQLNTWYHFVGTYDGSYMRFYRNGKLTNSVAGSGTLGGSGINMVVGSYSGSYYSQGLIPSIKIYNTTLSDQEILQNFNAQRGLYGI
ncbi:LamG domain-containing protein [bacterium]|nr:LamG domain-containing protein [bacterium]